MCLTIESLTSKCHNYRTIKRKMYVDNHLKNGSYSLWKSIKSTTRNRVTQLVKFYLHRVISKWKYIFVTQYSIFQHKKQSVSSSAERFFPFPPQDGKPAWQQVPWWLDVNQQSRIIRQTVQVTTSQLLPESPLNSFFHLELLKHISEVKSDHWYHWGAFYSLRLENKW